MTKEFEKLQKKALKTFLKDFREFERRLKKEQKQFKQEIQIIRENMGKIRRTNGVL